MICWPLFSARKKPVVWHTTGFPRGGALRPPAPLPVRGAGTNSEQTIERHGTYDCDSFGMNRAQTIEAHRTYACVFVEFQPKWPVEVSSCVVRDTMGSRCDRGSAGPPVRTRSTAWAFQKTVRVSQKGQQRCFLCDFAAFSGQTKIPIRHSIFTSKSECWLRIPGWFENSGISSRIQHGSAFYGLRGDSQASGLTQFHSNLSLGQWADPVPQQFKLGPVG